MTTFTLPVIDTDMANINFEEHKFNFDTSFTTEVYSEEDIKEEPSKKDEAEVKKHHNSAVEIIIPDAESILSMKSSSVASEDNSDDKHIFLTY